MEFLIESQKYTYKKYNMNLCKPIEIQIIILKACLKRAYINLFKPIQKISGSKKLYIDASNNEM